MTQVEKASVDAAKQLKKAERQVPKPNTDQERARREVFLQTVAEVAINPPHAAAKP